MSLFMPHLLILLVPLKFLADLELPNLYEALVEIPSVKPFIDTILHGIRYSISFLFGFMICYWWLLLFIPKLDILSVLRNLP